MIFTYRALDSKGRATNGEIEAVSAPQAKQLLRSRGLYITTIRESRDRESPAKSKAEPDSSNLARFIEKLSRSLNQVSSKERAMFSRQLGTLLSAGMELATALSDIADQTDNEGFRRIIWSLKEKVQEGAALSRSMELYPRVFNEIYIYMVRAGENLGRVDHILLRLAELEDKSNRIKSKIRTAMMYPTFMVILMSVVIGVLMTNVVPEITKVFAKSQKALPFPTQIVISMSDIMSHYWYILIVLFGAVLYSLRAYIKSPAGRSRWDHFKLHNRITKVMYSKIITTRFARNLGLLMQSRVDLIDSLHIVKKIVQNVHVEKAIEETTDDISKGGSLTRSLKSRDILPKMVLGMIAAGEASDKLDEMLLKIAEIYEEEVESSISSFMALLEPLIIVVMAIAVGFIVMSIILPLTQMNQLVS